MPGIKKNLLISVIFLTGLGVSCRNFGTSMLKGALQALLMVFGTSIYYVFSSLNSYVIFFSACYSNF